MDKTITNRNPAGRILLTPYLATTLAESYGLSAVGYYLAIAAVITFVALAAARSSMREK